MRTITDHVVNGCNEQLKIEVIDSSGMGGANHLYSVTGFHSIDNPSASGMDGHRSSFIRMDVLFQNGPLKESKPNGITHEAMLAILIDRLRGFQTGQFACRENAIVLTHLETAMLWLQKRTHDRLKRGVEGTLQK